MFLFEIGSVSQITVINGKSCHLIEFVKSNRIKKKRKWYGIGWHGIEWNTCPLLLRSNKLQMSYCYFCVLPFLSILLFHVETFFIHFSNAVRNLDNFTFRIFNKVWPMYFKKYGTYYVFDCGAMFDRCFFFKNDFFQSFFPSFFRLFYSHCIIMQIIIWSHNFLLSFLLKIF